MNTNDNTKVRVSSRDKVFSQVLSLIEHGEKNKWGWAELKHALAQLKNHTPEKVEKVYRNVVVRSHRGNFLLFKEVPIEGMKELHSQFPIAVSFKKLSEATMAVNNKKIAGGEVLWEK